MGGNFVSRMTLGFVLSRFTKKNQFIEHNRKNIATGDYLPGLCLKTQGLSL
jgi:hypothetical protein